jgi:muramoyltetrapeptide carboxypeptidase
MIYMIKPKTLKKGDLIGITAPSGAVEDPSVVYEAEKGLKALGFEVKIAKSCFQKYGYLAGRDEERARDLNRLFQDKDVSGILCIKGGYGATRILDMLDYDMIRENPKAFIGYSDITALHLAFHKYCDLVTFHGPVGYDVTPSFEEYSKSFFLKALTTGRPVGELFNPPDREIRCCYPGKAKGPLIGGNLSLVAATIGTKYEIDTKGKLLLLEDIDERPYRVDRMLTQLLMAGKLHDCRKKLVLNGNLQRYPIAFEKADPLQSGRRPLHPEADGAFRSGSGVRCRRRHPYRNRIGYILKAFVTSKRT